MLLRKAPDGLPLCREAELSELKQLGSALVKLEAYARLRGFDELAGLIDAAADYVDDLLTGPRPTI